MTDHRAFALAVGFRVAASAANLFAPSAASPCAVSRRTIQSPEHPRLLISFTASGVIRAVPLVPANLTDGDEKTKLVLELLQEALRKHAALKGRFDSAVQWFYSPMTAPCFLKGLGTLGIVYDCMDELANFKFAPSDIAVREQFLLRRADRYSPVDFHSTGPNRVNTVTPISSAVGWTLRISKSPTRLILLFLMRSPLFHIPSWVTTA